jgi:hypothetical protein
MTESETAKIMVFPEFDDIKVSTKTFIVMTNINVDLTKLFVLLPITDYTLIPKKKGRKKKSELLDFNAIIKDGSIISMKFENQIKGVDMKKKKSLSSNKKKSKWFRNSFTIVIMLDNKPVNFKVCMNGVLQITGCKFNSHAELCIKYLWDYIKNEHQIYSFKKSEDTLLESIIVPVMRNIDFSVNFNIDREKFSRYISKNTQFHSLLETSFGYTGCNIKLPLDKDIKTMKLKKLIFYDKSITEKTITYADYLDLLTEKDRQKKLNKDRYNSFLCFHSGRIIESGIISEYMSSAYYKFIEIIKNGRHEFEEKLDL